MATSVPLNRLYMQCQIKVLGALAMVDAGELDWKVIAINTNDPLSSVLNDASDVDKHMPGVISGRPRHIHEYRYQC